MKKVNVIGTTGSGKSTFAILLSENLGYPCIHMDQIFWKPNWVESSDEEFIPKVESAVSGESWILDGNYSRTNDIKWQHVDTIIWLDYSYSRTFFQLLRRTITRAMTREELWPGTGNRESFGKSFASRGSIFVWFFRCYYRNEKRYAALGESLRYSHIKFIRLHNPADAKAFIEHVSV